MTKSTITREQLEEWVAQLDEDGGCDATDRQLEALIRHSLAAMDSESGCLPLDYLQGHKDGLEWAAQLAEANHPETGDWLYDDPIELAKAIRKGPDMPPAQSVADSEPVIVVGDDGGDALSYRRLIQSFEPGTKLYRHAQPVPVVPDGYVMVPKEPTKEMLDEFDSIIDYGAEDSQDAWRRLLAAAPQSPGSEPATVPGKWIPVSERMPDENAEQQVLACFKGGDISTLYYFEGRWDDAYGIVPIRQDVTHWMPLPVAPKEGKT
nr:MAG TPA: Protein of unknown function (DUF551) [Caudoviricetes sp.]